MLLPINLSKTSDFKFEKHQLHSSDRNWPQSNCSVDLWIELLNSFKYNPVPALSFTIGIDHEGDQFTFFKFPISDLELLYGTRLCELSIYDNLESHVVTQVNRGHIVLVEVDGFYLPDTAGISYNMLHTKTTIGVHTIDQRQGTLTYFHNDTYGTLSGEDYREAMNMNFKHENKLFPYVEYVKRVRKIDKSSTPQQIAKLLLNEHIHYIPKSSPISSFRKVFQSQTEALTSDKFHEYAFNNFRMLGSNFELLSDFFKWFESSEVDVAVLSNAAKEISTQAKNLQFMTARMVHRSKYDPANEVFDIMEKNYAVLTNVFRG